MKLTEIENALRESLADDTLNLSAAASGCPAVDDLLAHIGQTAGLNLTRVRIDMDGSTLTVNGDGPFIGGIHTAVRAFFVQKDETVTVHMTAALPDSWRFSDSFPDLPDYIDFAPEHFAENPRPSFLNELSFDKPCLIVAETPVLLQEYSLEAPAGLSFAARVDPDGPLAGLKTLLPAEPLLISGPISLDGEDSGIKLSGAVFAPAGLGPLKFKEFRLHMYSPLIAAGDGPQPHIMLGAKLPVGAEASIILSSRILAGLAGPVEMIANCEGLTLPGIADLAAWIGGAEALQELPPVLQNTAAIRLDRVVVTGDWQRLAVDRVEIGLSTAGALTLWPGVLELETCKVRLWVRHPFDNLRRKMGAIIRTETEVLGIPMVIGVQAPSLTVLGSVQQNTNLSLNAVTKKLLPAALPLPEDLTVSQLAFWSDIHQKRLALSLALAGNWEFAIGAGAARIGELGLMIDVLGDALAESAVSVTGKAVLAGADIRFFAGLSAAGGWDVSIQLPPVDMAALIEAAAGKLGLIADLPALTVREGYIASSSADGRFEISGRCAQNWDIAIGTSGFAVSDLSLAFAYLTGPEQVAGRIAGTLQLAETPVAVAIELGDTLKLTGSIPRINLSALAAQLLAGVDLPLDLPDLSLTDASLSVSPATGDFSLTAVSPGTWKIPLGAGGIKLRDLNLALQRAAAEKGQHTTTGSIAGRVTLGGVDMMLTCNFPGEFVLTAQVPALRLSPLLQDLCGSQVFREVPIPDSLLALEFSDISVVAAPGKGTFALSGQSQFGQTEILVKRLQSGQWGFCVGFVPSASWRFSEISPELSVLDGLNFSNTVLILSSARDRDLTLQSIRAPRQDMEVVRGVNIFADIDLRGLGADQILGIEQLTVYAALGPKPADLALEASLDAQIQLGKGVVFGEITLRLRPAPPNFSLALLGTVTALIDNREMRFTGAMQVGLRDALFAGTMEGLWYDPFDAKGIAVADMALELGLSFAPLLPRLGIAGSLTIGNFQGRAAVKLDPAMPSRSMLAVGFNRLYLMDILRAFCDPALVGAIPQSSADTVLDIGWEGVDIYIVPQQTQIGEIVFEQGITLQGTMMVMGLRAFGYMNIDYVEGILVKAEVDPIDLGVLKVQGAGEKSKASLYLELRPRQVPVIDIAGAVELLGLRGETQLLLSEKGFFFAVSGKLFGSLFSADLEVSGSRFNRGGRFYVKAAMQNELFAYLRKEATAAIQQTTSGAVTALSKAQQDLSAKQREVDKLWDDIDRTRKIVEAERERDRRRLQEAQAAVSSAQAEVNRLQSEIDKAKSTIDYHKKKIAAKKRWYDQSKWYQKSYRWAEYAAEASWRGAAITGLYAAIGTLEAARWTAIGILEAAKLTLRGLEEATKIPIDVDPRVATLLASWGVATGALEAAKGFLQGIKLTLGAMGDVAQFIVDAGLGGIIDIRAAVFEAYLDTVEGGRVSMSVTLSFMGGAPKTLALDFDFGSPARAALSLAQALLPK